MIRQTAGYTILESMIFLAVSGLLFVAVISNYSGRENKTRFTQSVRDLESKVSDVINDASTGYFPKDQIGCRVNSGLATISFNSSGGAQQGTNEDCIYLGKVLHFNENSDGSNMNIMTVVGKRLSGTEIVSDLTQATPIAVVPSGSDNFPDLTEIYNLNWQVRVNKVINTDGDINIGSIGTLLRLSGTSAISTTSSTQQVDIIPVATSLLGEANEIAAPKINSSNLTTANPTNGVLICLSLDNEQAAILIGGKAGTAKTKSIFGREEIAAQTERMVGICD